VYPIPPSQGRITKLIIRLLLGGLEDTGLLNKANKFIMYTSPVGKTLIMGTTGFRVLAPTFRHLLRIQYGFLGFCFASSHTHTNEFKQLFLFDEQSP
jgi:hypothetical protein